MEDMLLDERIGRGVAVAWGWCFVCFVCFV